MLDLLRLISDGRLDVPARIPHLSLRLADLKQLRLIDDDLTVTPAGRMCLSLAMSDSQPEQTH